MITAVDTNVLLDILVADTQFGLPSAAAMRRCLGEGRVIASDAGWAEVVGVFPENEARAALARLEVDFGTDPMTEQAATQAGAWWRAYRRRGGPRDRVVADFLIGAHAFTQADQPLTRDQGFFRDYFEGLAVMVP